MSKARHAVIRVDASLKIGGGHVVRCMALAESMARDGWSMTFAGTAETREIVPALAAASYGWVSLPLASGASVLREAVPAGCDLLVVDHYELDAKYEVACRPWAKRILAIDDLTGRRHDCDILVDPTLGRPVAFYGERAGSGARIVSGPAYALLRPAFAAMRMELKPRGEAVRRILLSLGTTDSSNRLATLIAAFEGLDVSLEVAVGSAALDLVSIRQAVARAGARLHVDASNMAELMRDADMAVLAAGGTTWEAACLGLPIILIVTAENQHAVAEAMRARSAAVVVETPEEAVARVRSLMHNSDQREGLSCTASALCDGFGAQRVVLLAYPELDATGCPVTLRPATLDDADLIRQWQQAPVTRSFARNPAIPTSAEHRSWMERTLRSPRSILQMVMRDDVPAGTLRLDRKEACDYEISIVVDPALHQQGIGLATLKMARRFVPDARLLAHVLPGNEASRRLFNKAGFRALGEEWFAHEIPPEISRIRVAR